MRRALVLALDRKAFIRHLTGAGDVGGAMQPPPEGCGACRRTCSKSLPGYDPMCKRPRRSPRDHGKVRYRADKRLEVKVSERNIAIFRDPAVILIDQLKERST